VRVRRLWIGLAVAPLTLLAACGGNDAGSSDDKSFDVVFVGGLSGPLASLTVPSVNAIKAAAADINKNGGINGEDVTVETLDGQGDPTKSVTTLQRRLGSGDQPDLLFLGISSTEALAMVPAAMRAGVAATGIASTTLLDKPSEYPLFRGITNDAANQLVGLPDHLKAKGVATIAMVTTKDASGDAHLAGLKAALASSGVTVKPQRVAPDELDTSGVWDKVVADKPDMVYVNCLGDACARIMDGRLKAGATDIPLLGGISMAVTGKGPSSYVSSPDALKNADVVNYSFAVKSAGESDSEMLTRFLSSRPAADQGTSIGSPGLGWDAIYMFKYAAEAAKSTDATSMVKALDAGLPGSATFVTRTKLDFQGHLLPRLSATDMAIIPATTPIGADGRFTEAAKN
jgi:branched-chain amino acid transport system substrate-binding protein